MQYAPADAPQPVQYAAAAPAPYAAAPAQPVQFGTAPAPESQPMTYSTAPAGAAPIAYAAVPQPMPYAPVDAQPVQYAAPPMQYAAAPAQTMQYAPGEAPQPVQFAGAAPVQFAAGPGQPMPMQYAPAEAQPIQYASAEGQPVQFAPAPVTYAAPPAQVQGQTVQYAAPAGFDPGSWSPTPGAVVQLDGVVGAPEQNGRIGTVEGFDNENGRIIVLLSDNGERRGVRPENLVPAETSQPGAVQMMAAGADGEPAMWTPVPGSVVRLSNVAGAPEQNGRIGTVEAFDQENNRFVILFEDGERRGAKAENLEPAQMP